MNKILSLRRDTGGDSKPNRPSDRLDHQITLRAPSADDGFSVHELVSACPPLDLNSHYFYLVQCTDFADTCVLAEREGDIVGWVSAHRRPSYPNVLFVWQVAVHPNARGQSLAKRLIHALLSRQNCQDVDAIQTSVTADNLASLGVFRSLAKSLQTRLVQHDWLDREQHFRGCHDSEPLLTIGPFDASQIPEPTTRD